MFLCLSRRKVGSFSWVEGQTCLCGARMTPSFMLDLTALIFRTGGRHLQPGGRRPVLV